MAPTRLSDIRRVTPPPPPPPRPHPPHTRIRAPCSVQAVVRTRVNESCVGAGTIQDQIHRADNPEQCSGALPLALLVSFPKSPCFMCTSVL